MGLWLFVILWILGTLDAPAVIVIMALLGYFWRIFDTSEDQRNA